MPNFTSKNKFSDKRYLASSIQKRNKKHDVFVSLVFLLLKICFSLLAIVSLFRLGYSSKVRLSRLREIKDSNSYEKSRFKVLSNRFDDLFSFEGQQRFMKDQDQMISKDIIRVIWR